MRTAKRGPDGGLGNRRVTFERDKLRWCVWPLDGSLVSVLSPEGENVSESELCSSVGVQESLHGEHRLMAAQGSIRSCLSEQ